jgi:hypothetical protein
MPSVPSPADAAAEGWATAKAIGAIAEEVAALPIDEASARKRLRDAARQQGLLAVMREEPARLAAIRARIASCPPCVFFDHARDAAAAFGDADAAVPTFEPMAALIEGIRIIDDIQDEEEVCLAVEVGPERALKLARGALALSLHMIAALPLRGVRWRAACASFGRGLRETAIGQELERTATGGFASFWNVVDRKTAPLVATALETGALAAGAEPARAAELARLAVPFGRLLQIGDDCHDSLGPDAADWRAPQNNLLMAYALSGPNAAELSALLAVPATLREAKVLLLRDGALAYALHAYVTTLGELAAALESLALPNPAPFVRMTEKMRADTESLLRRSGVEPELAASLAR